MFQRILFQVSCGIQVFQRILFQVSCGIQMGLCVLNIQIKFLIQMHILYG